MAAIDDHGPTYVIIAALAMLAVMTSFIIFLDYVKGDAEHILTLFPIVMGTILSLVGLAWGVQNKNELEKLRNKLELNKVDKGNDGAD